MKIWTAIAVALLIAGCASYGPEINQQNVASIQEGVTTKRDLVSMFGQPMGVTHNSNGTSLMTWGSARSGFMYSDMESQGLTVTLDKSGKVVSYSHNKMAPITSQ